MRQLVYLETLKRFCGTLWFAAGLRLVIIAMGMEGKANLPSVYLFTVVRDVFAIAVSLQLRKLTWLVGELIFAAAAKSDRQLNL